MKTPSVTLRFASVIAKALFAITAVVISLISNVSWIEVTLVILLLIFEMSDLVFVEPELRWSPRGLFVAGWIFPFFIAQFPIQKYIQLGPSVDSPAYTYFFLIVAVYYMAEVFARKWNSRPLAFIERSNALSRVLDDTRYYTPALGCILIGCIAILAYFVTLSQHGFQFPASEGLVTDAASNFWIIPGLSTIFSMNSLFFLFVSVRFILSIQSRGLKSTMIKKEFILYLIISFILILFIFGYAKRMAFIKSLFPAIFLLIGVYKVRFRRFLLMFAIGAGYLIFNAYLRGAGGGYEQVSVSTSYANVTSVSMYSFLQPIFYATNTFGNFAVVMHASEASNILSLGSNTSILASIPTYRIIPLYALLSIHLNVILATMIMFLIFSIFWTFDRYKRNPFILLCYCVSSPLLLLLWTDLATNVGNYRILPVLMVWGLLVTSTGRARCRSRAEVHGQ